MRKTIISLLICILLVSTIVSANGDVDGNGIIEFEDLIAIATNFGRTSGYEDGTDTDGNGVIDIFDVVYVATRIGTEIEPPPPDENIVYAVSCSRNDIQSAIDSANSGDTVVLPSCNQNGFPGTVTVPANIEIRGQGKTSTVLSRTSADGTNPMFSFECSSSDRLKFSGMTLNGVGNRSVLERGVYISDICQDIRIWDARFDGFGYYGVYINNYNKGVIWDCDFIDCAYQGYGYGVVVFATYGTEARRGDKSHADGISLGDDNAIFLEDCTFENCRHSVAAARGSRYVFRYNKVEADYSANHNVDTHGRSDVSRGAVSTEVYGNTFTMGEPQYTAISYNSGEGVIFNNIFHNVNPNNKIIYFSHPCCGANNCGSYPEEDQPTNIYLWDNDFDGSPTTNKIGYTSKCDDELEALFIEGRDWIFEEMPGYSAYPYPHPLRN